MALRMWQRGQQQLMLERSLALRLQRQWMVAAHVLDGGETARSAGLSEVAVGLQVVPCARSDSQRGPAAAGTDDTARVEDGT